MEHSNNLVFKDSDFLGELFQSMIDHYRRIGRPENISQIFEKRITSNHRGVFQTNIHMDGEHPCIKSWYKKCYVKQYNLKSNSTSILGSILSAMGRRAGLKLSRWGESVVFLSCLCSSMFEGRPGWEAFEAITERIVE